MIHRRLIVLAMALVLAMTGLPGLSVAEEGYPESLTVFSGLSEHISKIGATSLNDQYAFQEIERRTGTHVEWIHPAVGSDVNAQINLMVASKNLPDIIVRSNWKGVSGGPAIWAEDGIILDLTDLIPENMPYYYEALTAMPTGVQELSVDGRMYFISEMQHGYPFNGPIYRGDWMEKMGMDYPTTVDELYETLVRFRDEDPNGNNEKDEWAMSGLSFKDGNFGPGHLIWAWGITYDFMQIDGKVTFGPLEPEFAEAMAYLNKLYAEGLLDPDYSTQDRNMLDGNYMNDKIGFEIGINPTKMNKAMEATGFVAMGGPNLRLSPDSPPYVFHTMYISALTSSCDAAITSVCKEPEKALRWLDFFFGGEGNLIANFGIEGLSYKLVDGLPVYDYSGASALAPDRSESDLQYLYRVVGTSTFPMRMSREAFVSTLHPYSIQGIEKWAASYDVSRMLPNVSHTVEELETINDLLVDINTYMDVQYDRLVTGQTALSEIPAVQERLRSMGIEEIIEIKQAAYDRFMGK